MRRLLHLLAALLLFVLGPLQVSPCGEGGCPDTLVDASEHIDGFLSKSGCTNPIAENTYLKVGTGYQVDGLATVSGYCARSNFECPTPQTCGCVVQPNEYRGVAAISIREPDYPLGGVKTYYPYPPNSPPVCDTRGSGTTTPDAHTWIFNAEGVRTLRYKNQVATAPTCETGTVSVETDQRFIVTKCIPQFQRDANGHLIHLIPPNPPQKILVYIPPGAGMNSQMRTGIENGINAMNDALTGSGLPVLEPTDVPCGGAYCINTQQDNIPTGQECAAQNITVNLATGEVISTTITFPSASGGWNVPFNTRLTRLAEHEFAHLMGLKENTTTCPADASLMRPVACGATAGFPTTPQPSDYLPVINSTYGQTPTTTCPGG